jgi:hypothetical protein
LNKKLRLRHLTVSSLGSAAGFFFRNGKANRPVVSLVTIRFTKFIIQKIHINLNLKKLTNLFVYF